MQFIKEQTRSKSIWKSYCFLQVTPIKESENMFLLLHKGEEENN